MVPVQRAPRSSPSVLALALLACVGALTLVSPAAGSPRRGFSAAPGPDRPDAVFAVTYRGAGTFHTVYHSEPPNPGGKHDTNDAHDSSAQRWSLRFGRLRIPTCAAPGASGSDPCTSVSGLSGATGPTLVTGRVRHVHVDGLYRQLDARERCGLSARTSARGRDAATVSVRYDAATGTFAVSAGNPVGTALSLFPAACPRGDSLDGLLDFYAPPGFSFDSAYGADRWFASPTVVIPARVFHRSSRVTVRLSDTRQGTPPRRCAVQHSYERCRTGGSWGGVLEFTAVR